MPMYPYTLLYAYSFGHVLYYVRIFFVILFVNLILEDRSYNYVLFDLSWSYTPNANVSFPPDQA